MLDRISFDSTASDTTEAGNLVAATALPHARGAARGQLLVMLLVMHYLPALRGLLERLAVGMAGGFVKFAENPRARRAYLSSVETFLRDAGYPAEAVAMGMNAFERALAMIGDPEAALDAFFARPGAEPAPFPTRAAKDWTCAVPGCDACPGAGKGPSPAVRGGTGQAARKFDTGMPVFHSVYHKVDLRLGTALATFYVAGPGRYVPGTLHATLVGGPRGTVMLAAAFKGADGEHRVVTEEVDAPLALHAKAPCPMDAPPVEARDGALRVEVTRFSDGEVVLALVQNVGVLGTVVPPATFYTVADATVAEVLDGEEPRDPSLETPFVYESADNVAGVATITMKLHPSYKPGSLRVRREDDGALVLSARFGDAAAEVAILSPAERIGRVSAGAVKARVASINDEVRLILWEPIIEPGAVAVEDDLVEPEPPAPMPPTGTAEAAAMTYEAAATRIDERRAAYQRTIASVDPAGTP